MAVARRADSVVVCEFGQDEIAGDLHKLVESAAFTEHTVDGKHISLRASGNMFHLVGDEHGLVALAVTDDKYSQAMVFSGLISDLRDRFLAAELDWKGATKGALSRRFRKDMLALCQEYDDEESKNKIKKLRASVDVTKGVMQDNIQKQLKNIESTEQMEEKSQQLVDSARTFNRQAKKLAWREWLMLQKLKCMLFLVLLVIIGVVVGVACGDGGCGGSEEKPSRASANNSTSGSI